MLKNCLFPDLNGIVNSRFSGIWSGIQLYIFVHIGQGSATYGRGIIAGTWAMGKTACWCTFWCNNVSQSHSLLGAINTIKVLELTCASLRRCAWSLHIGASDQSLSERSSMSKWLRWPIKSKKAGFTIHRCTVYPVMQTTWILFSQKLPFWERGVRIVSVHLSLQTVQYNTAILPPHCWEI